MVMPTSILFELSMDNRQVSVIFYLQYEMLEIVMYYNTSL